DQGTRGKPSKVRPGARVLERGRDRADTLELGLVLQDRAVLLERQRDVIEAAEQPTADFGVDLECDPATAEADLLRLEVDLPFAGRRERAHVELREHDREQPDL